MARWIARFDLLWAEVRLTRWQRMLRLRLDAPIPAGTRIEVSPDLATWLPWRTDLESVESLEWELEEPLSWHQFFRMVREDL
jgi:hypothetical protein